MYFVLYDKDLKTIGETYILESWNRTQRAADFDEINIVGEQIPYSANPFLVVVNDKQGKQMFSGLASTPQIDEKAKKTTFSLKDYMTLFNSEIVVDWSKFSGTTLQDLFRFILGLFREQIQTGFQNIIYSVGRLEKISLDTEIKLNTETIENVMVYDLISDAMNYYNAYCIPTLDLKTKTLTYTFYQAGVQTTKIKLSDFGLTNVEKSFGDYNRATVYDKNFVKRKVWGLTEDNKIARYPNPSIPFVYPAKNRNFIAKETKETITNDDGTTSELVSDGLNNAIYDAIMGLAGNRYQENIDLDAQRFKSIIDLTSIDFAYDVEVYMPDGKYKTLPVGEIETDSKGKHIVKLGHRVQELTQII